MNAEKTHGIGGYGERCHICHRTVKSLAGLSRHMTLKHPSIHSKPSLSIPTPYPGQLREVILSSQPSHQMEIERSTSALSIESASTQPSDPNEIDSIPFHHRKFQPLDHHEAPNCALHPFSDSDSEESSSSDDIIRWSETIASQEGSGEFTKLEDDDPWNLSDVAELEDGFFNLDTDYQWVEESEGDTQSTVTSTSSSTQIEEHPKASGTWINLAVPLIEFSNNLAREPWQPFRSAEDFTLARWLVDAAVPKTHINRFFNTGMAIGRSLSYTSGDSLWNQIARMPEHLPKWIKGTYTADDTTIPFYYRDIIQVV
ncbi:hypothetical protein EX30DRAFT_166175 [Ascodesmis nigricans]|uniref:C2H2-type domain-containing protein n=1 Tax=Ascodesmis nigricans TaxID=341454 RepID=A0A4S2MM21_9PEZI|nr:hypothetical protein EX30DRAFT_166175 [Ascodesmis nigricans]